MKLYFSLCLHTLSTDGERLQEQVSLIVSTAFFFLSNTLHYGFICLRDAIVAYELCFSRAYGIAALRGLRQPLTINEMWHGNLW